MSFIKNFFSKLLRDGVKISYSSGNAFDPYYQKRVDAIDDLLNNMKIVCEICGKKRKQKFAFCCPGCKRIMCNTHIYKKDTLWICKGCKHADKSDG